MACKIKSQTPDYQGGARLVGKSTLVREFAPKNGHDLVEINLKLRRVKAVV